MFLTRRDTTQNSFNTSLNLYRLCRDQAQLMESAHAPNVSVSVISYERLVAGPRRVLESLARDLQLPSDAVFSMLSSPDLHAKRPPDACRGVRRKCESEQSDVEKGASIWNSTDSEARELAQVAFARAGPWPLFAQYTGAAA